MKRRGILDGKTIVETSDKNKLTKNQIDIDSLLGGAGFPAGTILIPDNDFRSFPQEDLQKYNELLPGCTGYEASVSIEGSRGMYYVVNERTFHGLLVSPGVHYAVVYDSYMEEYPTTINTNQFKGLFGVVEDKDIPSALLAESVE